MDSKFAFLTATFCDFSTTSGIWDESFSILSLESACSRPVSVDVATVAFWAGKLPEHFWEDDLVGMIELLTS